VHECQQQAKYHSVCISNAGIGATQLAKLAGAPVIGTSRTFTNDAFAYQVAAKARRGKLVIKVEPQKESMTWRIVTKGAGHGGIVLNYRFRPTTFS